MARGDLVLDQQVAPALVDYAEPWSAGRVLRILATNKAQTTLCYYGCFLALGLAIAALGPALLALAENTGSSVAEMGYVFTARSVGYLFGSMVGGPLFDRLDGNKLLAVALGLTVVGTALIPVVSDIWLLAALVTLVGLAMGFLDTGGNVSIIRLHGDNVGPYLQAMHFSFGFGAFVAPMVVGWVIDVHQGDPSWAFWAMSIGTAVLPVWLLLLGSAPAKTEEKELKRALVPREKYIVIAAGLFLLVDVGAEVTAGGYLYSYAVLENLATETSAAFLTSVLWGALTIGRLISIPASLYFSAAQILAVLMVGCVGSNLLMAVFSNSSTVLWLGAFLYGLSISSAFPTAMHLAEGYVPLTGSITSVMVVGASLGEMLIPLTVANVSFNWYSPVTFLYILLACSVAGLLIYVSMLVVGGPIKKDPNHRSHSDIVVEEEDDEEFIGGGGEAWMSLASQHHQDGAYGTFTNKDRSA
ncbi:transporter, major facilitator subfamily protein [Acanthamoeba castellanii str. Neff]|uniref:Transporter, major facilitator subfamily protein n=1 Tax=Acanthamoeba castellanii (strain ATCC 30010 / Neff) TaxID=1257118 RepID=L8GYI3_ACACF|nr:transporter, major facilitator subfamily protein [Acanthamoeba castellanii str. Neff]ELR17151.1 transporter, major facilitator subfamily protein [Acanthamoeba castellanii str. Neff]